MTIAQAKRALDKVIAKSRVHFYKPFQIAEILRKHRNGDLSDLRDLESYRNPSRLWRDVVSRELVGRISTSSARFQDDLFNTNACPPDVIAALGEYNRTSGGAVEAYIYRTFQAKVTGIGRVLADLRSVQPEDFSLENLLGQFEHQPGLRRSIDKIYEITVYALFSTIVREIGLRVSLTMRKPDSPIVTDLQDFLAKVVGIPKGRTSVELPATLFRLGSTNAADRGLDMVANFGPVIQVKYLTLDAESVTDICDGLTADRIVIVCKAGEAQMIDSVLTQVGTRVQSIITLDDLKVWYSICFESRYKDSLGKTLLIDYAREFSNEFPSLDELPGFLERRRYGNINLTGDWAVPGA